MTDWKRERRRSINNRELLLAVSDNDLEEVQRLLGDYVDVNFRDQHGFTALHLAAEFADAKVVRLLMEAGASVDNKNDNQETPLDIARRLNKLDVVSVLQPPAKPNSPPPPPSTDEVVKVSVIPQSQPLTNGVTTNGYHKHKREVWINPVHGNIYQLKILMLFLYRGIACKYSFRLGTEIKEARKFDDLVFEYTQDGEKVYRLLQAKHKIDESKKITVDKLLSEISGDYSLVKYFHSYQASKSEDLFKDGTIRDVTICTNVDFDHQSLKEAQIELRRVEEKDDILDVEIDGKLPARYRFTDSILPKLKSKLKQCRLSSRRESDSDVADFLSRLVFAVNQPNEEELGDIVRREISREFEFISSEDAYNKFFVRMLDWMKSRQRASFWSCDDGRELFDEVRKGIPVWFDVQSPAESFTGRVDQLERMHKLLQTGSKTSICVSGLGGVGKSELVKQYIRKHSHCYDDKVVWINAENYRSLVHSFRRLACDKLGISTLNADGKEKDARSLAAETYQYFSKGRSLFVFDNAEVYQSYGKYDAGIERFMPALPPSCRRPHVVVTSRNAKWPKTIKVLLLEGFSEEEAASFVEASLRLENSEQKERVTELGRRLQMLPLALRQAVAYVSAQNEKLRNLGSIFTVGDYLERLTERSEELLNFSDDDCDGEYAKTVFTTWNVTLEAIRTRKNGCDAANLMNTLAYLLPDDIPVDILFMFVKDRDKLATAVEVLKQYSLIDVQHKRFNVHRLVQQVVRAKLAENESDALREILQVVEITKIEPRNIDHFVCLWTHAKKYPEIVDEFFEVSERIAKVVLSCGRFKQAYAMGSEMKSHLRKQPKRDVQTKLNLLDTRTLMAGALLDKGRGNEALTEFRKIYEAQKALRGANTRETLGAKRNLAYALNIMEKSEEALKCYQEVLKDSRIYLGENDPDTLATRNNIATFLIDEEKYDEALLIFREIHAVQKLIYAEEHDYVLVTKNNIANVLCKQNKTEEALKIWQDIYEIQRSKLAEEHPDVLHTRGSIANVLFEQEKYAAALEIYEDLLRIKSEMYGEEHSEVVDIRVDIACTLKMQGKFNDALIILHELLKKQIGESGLYNPHVPKTLNAMASVLYDQEKYPEAFKTYQELLSCQITMFGRDDLKTVNTRGYIAGILTKQGKYDAALENYREMFRITKEGLGMNHRTTLAARHEIGVMALCKKEYDKAWDILTEVLVAQEALLGREHMDYITTLKNLAIISAQREKLGNHSSSAGASKPNGPLAAIADNDLAQLKKLVKEGADVNAQDRNLLTLLHHAVVANQPGIVKFLLSSGADVNKVTSKGETALHVAASKGHLAIVKILLDHPSYHELRGFVDARTVTENTALHLSAVNGFLEVTMHLLQRGATYDLKNQNDQLPVDLAVDRYLNGLLRKVYVHSELAKYGVEEVYNQLQHHSYEEYLALVNARNSQGHTMLTIAVVNKREKVVKLLVKLRVDKAHLVNAMPSFNSNLNELLAHASIAIDTLKDAKSSFRKVVTDVGDLVSVFRTYDKGSSDSNVVVVEDMLRLLETHEDAKSLAELAKFVIGKHLALFARSIHTIQLYEAAKNDDLLGCQELIAKSIDVDARDKGGWTPLHFAINVGNERMVELLLARGAEVNCITNMGKFTPLHIAVNKGHVKIVELLLSRSSRGEFVDAKTEAKGSTAMHVAAKNGNAAIVTHLLARGASYCMRNKDGQTPAELAEEPTIKEIFRLIDELFSDAEKGRAEVIGKLKALGPTGIQTVIRVRNDEGFSMTEVAALKDHRELASQILNMVKTTFNLPESLGLPKLVTKKKK